MTARVPRLSVSVSYARFPWFAYFACGFVLYELCLVFDRGLTLRN